MKQPLTTVSLPVLELNPQLKPIPHFKIRPEPFGYLLTRYNWSVPVTASAKPLLEAINGENTLLQLQTQFGEAALELIGQLYQEKWIDFI